LNFSLFKKAQATDRRVLRCWIDRMLSKNRYLKSDRSFCPHGSFIPSIQLKEEVFNEKDISRTALKLLQNLHSTDAWSRCRLPQRAPPGTTEHVRIVPKKKPGPKPGVLRWSNFTLAGAISSTQCRRLQCQEHEARLIIEHFGHRLQQDDRHEHNGLRSNASL
jgi:hypothetical protein